jgi:phosphoesterase RecJ-like protein
MPELAPEFFQGIRDASSVLISTHLNPDGDALGSALAVSFLCDEWGITNEVVCHHAPPANLEFLPGIRKVQLEPKFEKHDLGIILDLDSIDRLGSVAEPMARCDRTFVVDHHVPHDKPGDLRIIDQSAAATAAILARMMVGAGTPITAEMAMCLLTGIVTDTGSFRFRNTNAECLTLAAKLLEAGANINQISEEVFQRKPLASMRLLGYLLERMQLECEERLAWGALTVADFELTHASDEDTEGFVNELLSVRTVQLAAIFRQTKPYKVRVSLRSRGNLDVSAVARIFNGGGHRNAAGCSFDTELDEAIQLLLPELRKCLASS